MTRKEVKAWFESKTITDRSIESSDFNGGGIIDLMTELVNSSNVIPIVSKSFTEKQMDDAYDKGFSDGVGSNMIK